MGRKKQPEAVQVKGRSWTQADVRDLLVKSEAAQIRALLLLYSMQTEHEKMLGRTGEFNGIGFNKVDAEILSSFARGYKNRGYLTPKQYGVLGKRIPKYAGQIFRHMKETNQ